MGNIIFNSGIERKRQLLTRQKLTDSRIKDIQVICLDEYNLRLLQTIEDGHQYNFHSLIDMEKLRNVDRIDMPELLRETEQRIETESSRCDAITTFIDFPVVELMAYLTDKYRLSGPTLNAVLKCNHK